MALSSILGPNSILAPSGSTGHSDLYDFSCPMTPGNFHGLRRLTRSQASSGHSVATGATDVNSDPCCCRVTDQDKALSNCLGPNNTKALGGSTSHSDLYGSSCSMTLKLQQGHRLCGPDCVFPCGLCPQTNLLQAIFQLRLPLHGYVNLTTKISHRPMKSNLQVPCNHHYSSEKLVLNFMWMHLGQQRAKTIICLQRLVVGN